MPARSTRSARAGRVSSPLSRCAVALAETEARAREQALSVCQDCFPPVDGWYGHSARVLAVSRPTLRQALAEMEEEE